MGAKGKIKNAGYNIRRAGYWLAENGSLIPVTLIQIPCGQGITVGGNRRQIGRRIREFARTVAG